MTTLHLFEFSWRPCWFVAFTVSSLFGTWTVLGEPLKIRPKQCTNALGELGTCMFVWECIKTEGKHLGTCVDGFLFGSCCGHNESYNSITNFDQVESHERPSLVTEQSILSSNKDKPKNKWKPAAMSTTTSTTPQSIDWNKVESSTHRWSPVLSSSTTAVPYISSAAISSVNSKPSTSKPWSHQPGDKPLSVVISVLASQPPSIHYPTLAPFKSTSTVKPNSNSNSNSWNTNDFFGGSATSLPSVVTTSHDTFYPNRPIVGSEESSSQQSVIINTTNVNSGGKQTTQSTPTLVLEHTTELYSTVVPVAPVPVSSENKFQCGVTRLRPKTKVVGGKNSVFGAWPWQVSVRRTSFFGFSSTHRCGGAILNNQWVATAGHCVDDLLLTQIRIRVGEYDFSSSMEPLPHIERAAKKKIVHPKYNFFTYENDLALVQLEEPIEFQQHISAICLPPDDVNLLGKNATVTGWGRLSEGGVLPTVLQEVRVPIVSNDKCKNMFLSAGRHEYIPDIFMCAGYDEGGRDSCQGDSGGPLQVQGDDGHWFLAGIISWGIGCGEPSLPGVCTRISRFKQWILSYISE